MALDEISHEVMRIASQPLKSAIARTIEIIDSGEAQFIHDWTNHQNIQNREKVVNVAGDYGATEDEVLRPEVLVETPGTYRTECRRCNRVTVVIHPTYMKPEAVRPPIDIVDRCSLCDAELLRLARSRKFP